MYDVHHDDADRLMTGVDVGQGRRGTLRVSRGVAVCGFECSGES